MQFSEGWLRERLEANPHLRAGDSYRPAAEGMSISSSSFEAGKSDIGTPDPLATAVLPRPSYSVRLGPEDALQAEICFRFNEGTFAGRWRLVAAMIGNEVRMPVVGKKRVAANPELAAFREEQLRRAHMVGARLKAMGMLPGITDLILLWPGDAEYFGGVGFLEVKKEGQLSAEQKAWRDLCQGWRLPWGVARSWEQAFETARTWGAVAG